MLGSLTDYLPTEDIADGVHHHLCLLVAIVADKLGKVLEAETDRTRKEQSFLVPVEDIRNNDYDLSINKYKEVEREKVVYDAPDVIFDRIASLQDEINNAMAEFKEKYL